MRPTECVIDPLGNEVKVPTTIEAGDWFGVCQTCGKACVGTFGREPDDDMRQLTACPQCGHVGEPHIQWQEATA